MQNQESLVAMLSLRLTVRNPSNSSTYRSKDMSRNRAGDSDSGVIIVFMVYKALGLDVAT